MKKLTGLMLLIAGGTFFAIGAYCKDYDDCGGTSDVSGHTFFTIRPEFQPATPEQVSLFRDRALARECGIGGAVQIVPFGGRSTAECELARYFMFNDKSKLTVNSDQSQFPDINPVHFGIACSVEGGTYSSTIKFSPRRTTAGVFLQYHQFLGEDKFCGRLWWINIAAPIQYVRTNVRLEEKNREACTNFATDALENMLQAFNGDEWTPQLGAGGTVITGQEAIHFDYGKIKTCKSMDETRVADIQLRLGGEYVNTECCHAEGWIGIWIPTGNRPKGEYVFEPIVGQNFHVGIMTGGELGYLLWEGDCDRELRFELSINSIYSFKNTQTRSFDLLNRPWSRYMLTFANENDANDGIVTPGINIFTRQVHVSPRFQHNYTMALVFDQCSFQGEIGYNFWARQAEKIKLKCCWVDGPAIAALDETSLLIQNTAADSYGISRLSNIGDNNAGSCSTFNSGVCGPAIYPYSANTIIKVSDLNLNSAAHPGAMSHTIYGAIGYCWDHCDWPMLVGAGGSYEFTGVNTALNRWLVWGKFSVSF